MHDGKVAGVQVCNWNRVEPTTTTESDTDSSATMTFSVALMRAVAAQSELGMSQARQAHSDPSSAVLLVLDLEVGPH